MGPASRLDDAPPFAPPLADRPAAAYAADGPAAEKGADGPGDEEGAGGSGAEKGVPLAAGAAATLELAALRALEGVSTAGGACAVSERTAAARGFAQALTLGTGAGSSCVLAGRACFLAFTGTVSHPSCDDFNFK